MPSSFHNLLEHLINSTYQHHRESLAKLYGKTHSLAISYVRFGGWEINYTGKGRTRLGLERVRNIPFISKEIYLNINYTYHLAGLPISSIYNFPNLIYTVAHEIAHCLLGDFNLEWAQLHNDDHAKLTQEIGDYLWTLPEVKELEKIQKFNNDLKNH